jgi:hypothetical protein
VELSGTTFALTLQAKDEYDGPVSSVASAIGSISSRLSDVPVIGKFARATTIGVSAIAKIASMFGFTNCPVIDPIHAVQPTFGPQLASSEVSSQITKLTLDPKQELSIDPSLHGVGSTDELGISHIISKPTTLTVVDWSTVRNVGDVLFYARVNPALYTFASVPNANRVNHSFLSYVSQMFHNWHGDIIFDIEVVCTKFHKGRIRVTWDPIYDGSSVPPENTAFTTILDISHTNNASFTVPYHQAYSWLKTRHAISSSWSHTPLAFGFDEKYDNGALFVSVLTPLISPVTPSTVGIRVAVRGGPNFEFTNPGNFLGTGDGVDPSCWPVQSEDTVDLHTTEIVLGDNFVPHPERYGLNFGERVVSLRQLLHRMTLCEVNAPTPQSALFSRFRKSYGRKPCPFGYDPEGTSLAQTLNSAPATANFNYTSMHPMTYVAAMYGGMRGSVNYLVHFGNDFTNGVTSARVYRDNYSSNANWRRWDQTGVASSVTASGMSRYLNDIDRGNAGCAVSSTYVNSSLSFCYPMMTQFNFDYTDFRTVNPNDSTLDDSVVVEIVSGTSANSQANAALQVHSYAGTGVDWTCLWLLATPTLDYYFSVPAAV